MKGSGRLASGEAGHFKPVADNGCKYAPKCLSCPFPACKLEILETKRQRAIFHAHEGAVTAGDIDGI